jgi:hypothetical protein
MATTVQLPNNRYEAPLVIGDLVNLVLRAQEDATGPAWTFDDIRAGKVGEFAFAGDIDEAKAVAEAAAKAHARHFLRRANSNEQIPQIVWHQM